MLSVGKERRLRRNQIAPQLSGVGRICLDSPHHEGCSFSIASHSMALNFSVNPCCYGLEQLAPISCKSFKFLSQQRERQHHASCTNLTCLSTQILLYRHTILSGTRYI